MRTIAVGRLSKHTEGTCGQSRRGGFVPSHGERRSEQFGRVVVIMSKARAQRWRRLGFAQGYKHPALAGASIFRGVHRK